MFCLKIELIKSISHLKGNYLFKIWRNVMGMTLINFMMSIEFDFEFEFLLKIYIVGKFIKVSNESFRFLIWLYLSRPIIYQIKFSKKIPLEI